MKSLQVDGKMQNRNQSIDIVKRVGIILMIVGHSYSTDSGKYILQWLYSFHMPLFFITTGVLYGIKGGVGALHLRRKLQSLVLPYFIYATVYQLFLGLLAMIGGAPWKENLLYRLLLVLEFEGSAMWFLPTMFLAWLLFHGMNQCGKAVHMICAALAMAAGIFLPAMDGVLGCISRALIGFAFITLGYYIKSWYAEKQPLYILLGASVCHLLAAFCNTTVDLANHSFGNPCLYILESCLGTFVIYQIAIRAQKVSRIVRPLEVVGKYSVVFLCLHGFVIQVIRLLDYKLLQVLSRLQWAEGILLAFLVVLIIALCLPVIIRYFGWSFGIVKGDSVREKKAKLSQ